MLERLYYADPYLKTFTARVIERLQWDGRPAVVLDRTAFYPTGGGQPHDTGTLQGIAVVDVVEREADAAVVHLLDGPLEAERIEGRIDWDRRFDLMQQHTGQHILSAAFVECLEANTVGFHLSDEYTTIDLDRALLSAEDLAAVETRANSVVLENRPIDARFVADEEVATLSLRKPLAHEGPVHIVSIPDVDLSACGGTHVRATGEVGLIKITRSERRGPIARVEFLCGWRALADYQTKNATVMNLASELTVGHWEVADAVRRLAEELKESRRELRRTRDAWLDAEAMALWYEAPRVGGARLVKALFTERTPDDLKHLAQRLASQEKTVALLAGGGGAGEKGHFTFARSADLDVHMGLLVRQACEVIGGRGGGRPEFAQGGGSEGQPVGQALDRAFQSLVASMGAKGEAGKAK